MPKDVKAVLFAVFGVMFCMTFILGYIQDGWIGAAVLIMQISGLFIGILVGFLFFLWIGIKIFKDK